VPVCSSWTYRDVVSSTALVVKKIITNIYMNLERLSILFVLFESFLVFRCGVTEVGNSVTDCMGLSTSSVVLLIHKAWSKLRGKDIE
jgi:hypothetical protein